MHLLGISLIVMLSSAVVTSSRLSLEVFSQHHTDHHQHHHRPNHRPMSSHRMKPEFSTGFRISYQLGSSESELPECSQRAVCNKVDLHEYPSVERQCRCPGGQTCPVSLAADDGHTLSDKTIRYKLCKPIKKLPECRNFRDPTWTLLRTPDNITKQIVHCHCLNNSFTYLKKEQPTQLETGEFGYQFFCSPQKGRTLSLCQRKEPCRIFTVRKRQEFLDELKIDTICECPHAHRCPHRHTDYGVFVEGSYYIEKAIRIYKGFCTPTN